MTRATAACRIATLLPILEQRGRWCGHADAARAKRLEIAGRVKGLVAVGECLAVAREPALEEPAAIARAVLSVLGGECRADLRSACAGACHQCRAVGGTRRTLAAGQPRHRF